MSYSPEGFKLGKRPEAQPKSDDQLYHHEWKSKKINRGSFDDISIADYIADTYSKFLAAEDGRKLYIQYNFIGWTHQPNYSTRYRFTGEEGGSFKARPLCSKKIKEFYPSNLPKGEEHWAGNSDIFKFSDYSFEAWRAESWNTAGGGGTRFSSSSGYINRYRTVIKTYFLSEGDPQGKLFVDGKPAITLFRANFEPQNVRILVQLIEEKTGAKIVVVDKPRVESNTY